MTKPFHQEPGITIYDAAAYWQKWRSIKRPYVKRTCSDCGIEFLIGRSGNPKTCELCRYKSCEICSKKFKPYNRSQRFCSWACKSKSQRGIEPEHLAKNRGRKPRTMLKAKRDKHGCVEDIEWRISVFKRDGFLCQHCKKKGGRLQAHHIKPYKAFPSLRHVLENGVTLCLDCHKKTDSYGWSNYWNRLRQETLALT